MQSLLRLLVMSHAQVARQQSMMPQNTLASLTPHRLILILIITMIMPMCIFSLSCHPSTMLHGQGDRSDLRILQQPAHLV